MKEKNKAFTLIELVVTMSIVAILFVTATPLFTEFQQASRLNSAAQILETILGEAFSSAHSRPECFVVETDKKLAGFTMKSYSYENKECKEDEKTSRDFAFSSGVEVFPAFKINFEPPFGDLEFLPEDDPILEALRIELYNNGGENKVSLMIYKNSGLVTRIANQESDE